MKTVLVQVQGDHLKTLTGTRAPADAIAELIWNSLDADATQVRVDVESNCIGGLKFLGVSDNGPGLAYDDTTAAFEKLGGSWKRTAGNTRGKGRASRTDEVRRPRHIRAPRPKKKPR